MAAVIYIICVVVGFLIIILWASNDVLRDEIDSLKELVNDYNKLTIKTITKLENEIKSIKDEQKQKKTQEF